MSPGLSWKFFLGLVDFRGGAIDDAVVRYRPDVVLYYVGVQCLLVPGLLC